MPSDDPTLRVPIAEAVPDQNVAIALPHVVDVHLNGDSGGVRRDIQRGLTNRPRSLPPKYFYDSRGSGLFEQITELPEYYLTRAEQEVLSSVAGQLMDEFRPQEVVELEPGSTAKVRTMLDAPGAARYVTRYIPFDVDEENVRGAVHDLTASYPFLQVHGVVGDFEKHLPRVPRPHGGRLVAFFGSTIGNLDAAARKSLLGHVRNLLKAGDRFVLGVDLIKGVEAMEAAYNDPTGVTGEFNRNILRVVNRAVNGDFQPEAFRHHAFYNHRESRIEMHLVPMSPQSVTLRDLPLSLRLTPDESIWTESSYKFTRTTVQSMMEEVGMCLERWFTDARSQFALAVARPE